MYDYNLCVIGGGPAGFAAAMRAWDFGRSVCLVEKSALGGTGLHNGALSSKTLWELSRQYRTALQRDRGYTAHGVEVDFRHVAHCVDTAVNEKAAQLARQLEMLSKPGPGHPGSVSLVRGSARFLDPHLIEIDGTEPGHTRTVSAANFVIATGSRPRMIESMNVDGRAIMTSDDLIHLDHFPSSIVIVGAGVVGCEFATILANYGKTKVYLIDRADRILPFEDPDISRLCSRNLEAKGVTIHRQANLVSIGLSAANGATEVEYTIEHATGGRESIRVDKALISIGREPNTEALDLDKAGVAVTDRGHIACDDTVTSVPHIYAVGDVTLDIALVSVGEIEGRHAVELMEGEAGAPLRYDNLSTIMFLDPEVAAIGRNEQQAQAEKISYRVAVYGYSLVNRAIAMRATDGFVKVLVSDDDDLRILGMRALGVHASTTIEAVSLMMHLDCSARDLAELFHPHPAVTEGVQDCVRMLTGTSILKPHVFTSDLRLSRVSHDGGS